MSNSLDPDQAQHFLGLALGPTVCKGYRQMAPSRIFMVVLIVMALKL